MLKKILKSANKAKNNTFNNMNCTKLLNLLNVILDFIKLRILSKIY